MCEGLLAGDTSSWEVRYTLSKSLNGIGGVAWELGRIGEAEPACAEAVAIMDELGPGHAERQAGAQARSTCSTTLANLLAAQTPDAERLREAETLLRKALALQQGLASTRPTSTTPARRPTTCARRWEA